MVRNVFWCGVVLVGASAPAAAQEETRTFPEAECSYTLPGKDWVWRDADLVQKPGLQTIVFAQNAEGLALTVRFDRVGKGERTDVKGFESYEAGLLNSGRLKKVNSKHDTFRGVPSYQINATVAGNSATALRALYAHDRFYELAIIRAGGPVVAEAEAESIFRGFNFTKPPALKPNRPEPPPRPLLTWGAMIVICVGAAVVAVVGLFGLVALVVHLSRKNR